MQQEIDPFTGLPLRTISPTAPQRAVNPFESGPIISAPIPIEPVAQPAIEAAAPGLPATGFLDKIIFGLTGNPDSDLSPEELSKRRGRQAEAQGAANSAAAGEGGNQYMQYGGGASGGSSLESLGKIFSLFAGGGGG